MMIPTRLQLGVLRFQRHCVKCVRIRSFSGPYFPAFRLNIERDTKFPSVLSPNAGKYRPEKLRIRTLITHRGAFPLKEVAV